MRHAAAAVALAAFAGLTGCGGGSPSSPSSSPTPSASTTKPKPKPKPTASVSPTPTVTTPPPPSGQPMTSAGAFLAFVPPGEPKRVGNAADCAAIFPDLAGPACGSVPMDAGSLLWGSGRVAGRLTVRLLTQDASGGYVVRYEGAEGGTKWASVKVVTAAVVGKAPDGVGVVVALASGAATYDLLTWVKGGPLVLRAHRSPLPDGRLGPLDAAFGEYLLQPDGIWVRRRVAWDGTRFLLSAGARVPASAVPPR
jgi:hypothetical protein